MVNHPPPLFKKTNLSRLVFFRLLSPMLARFPGMVSRAPPLPNPAFLPPLTPLCSPFSLVVTQHVNRIRVVREKGETIIKEVPVYVPVQADAACTINRGFVRLHDAAAAGELPEMLMRPPQTLRSLPSPEPLPPTTRPATKTPSN